MKDLIERQAVIDALQEEIVKWTLPDDTAKAVRCGVRSAKNIVEDLPSVRPDIAQLLAYECGKASAQPEIIRCNDCEYYKSYTLYGQTQGFCNRLGLEVVELDDFCSRAERRK